MPNAREELINQIASRILYQFEIYRIINQQRYFHLEIKCKQKDLNVVSKVSYFCKYENGIAQFLIDCKSVHYKKMVLAKASDTFSVSFPLGKFVVKRICNKTINFLTDQEKILGTTTGIMPNLLYWGKIGVNKYAQIYNLVPGRHVYKLLNKTQTINVIRTVKNFSLLVNKLSFLCVQNLHDLIKEYCSNLKSDKYLSNIGREFLANLDLRNESKYLTHFDLHRGNILFDRGSKTTLVDPDSVIYSPKEFQAACLFASCFLLYEDSKYYNTRLNTLIDLWGKPVDEEKIRYFIGVRAWIGAAFFEAKLIQDANDHDAKFLLEKYTEMVKYFYQTN